MSKKEMTTNCHKMTPATLERLRELFIEGISDERAAKIVGIHPDTLYKFCQKNPAFSREKEALKNDPILKSIKLLNRAIDAGDINSAKWLLERKVKDEYSVRTELDVNDEPERKFTSIKLIEGKKIIKLK